MVISEFHAHCDQHGAYIARRVGDRNTGCPECADAEMRVREIARKRRENRMRIVSAVRRADIPARFIDARIGQLQPTLRSAVEGFVVNAAADRTRGPLILSGPVGTGKSHAAVAAIRKWIAVTRGLSARYVTAAGYCDAIRACWGSKSSDESQDRIQRTYAQVPALVLDDLGAGRPSDLDLLQTLICARYDADLLRATIIPTNIAGQNFDSAFGERIADRLREGAVMVPVLGPSRRRPAA